MSMLIPPQMLNTMAPLTFSGPDGFTEEFLRDPVRRYMLPVRADRDPRWPSHPHSARDSLHEAEMWVVEGLTHRYPTKVLAELVTTCPQYCGHCTRMDLVGNSTAPGDQGPARAQTGQPPGADARLSQANPRCAGRGGLRRGRRQRAVAAAGGVPARSCWSWTRSATSGWRPRLWWACRSTGCSRRSSTAWPRWRRLAGARGVNLAVHTHANHARSVTPLVAQAARALLEAGVRDVRNQGVLMRGVNATQADLLDLCFALHGEAGILPYYFYMCDMIPNAEHWRLSVAQAQLLQDSLMGYLPGYATPRLVCDVPYAGKRWVHQVTEYDRERGISYWTTDRHTYYDPISTLPESGRRWWSDYTRRRLVKED